MSGLYGTGECLPSIRESFASSGTSRTVVEKALRSLEDIGQIRRVFRRVAILTE